MNQRVRLKTFKGTAQAPQDCNPQENYWLFIGQGGWPLRRGPQRLAGRGQCLGPVTVTVTVTVTVLTHSSLTRLLHANVHDVIVHK